MEFNTATNLTLFRIVMIPVLVVFFYIDARWANWVTTGIFVVAAITDWADGYIARRFNQESPFGAFLDPVADKLMVGVALVLLVEYHSTFYFAIPAAIIIGREITISALREWMAQIGKRTAVKVQALGKVKTTFQMIALILLLFREDFMGLPMFTLGHICLWIAAGLTLISMVAYLRVAWPLIQAQAMPPKDDYK